MNQNRLKEFAKNVFPCVLSMASMALFTVVGGLKVKKNKNLSELMSYAGKHKYLTYSSLILSIVSAILSLLPFVFIFFIIKEVIEVMPDYSAAVNVARNGWMAVLFALISLVIYIGALMCSQTGFIPVWSSSKRRVRTGRLGNIVYEQRWLNKIGSVFIYDFFRKP